MATKPFGTDYASGMYCSKMLNTRMVDGNKYITIGDPYKDPAMNMFRQGKKGDAPKPFITKGIPMNAENGNFQKLTYNAGPYKEGMLYISTQPLDARKNGFGSKDAHRRDEFSNEIRCSQYREGIKKELEISRKAISADTMAAAMSESNETVSMTRTRGLSKTGGTHEYDIGRTQVTEFDPKSTHDQYHKMSFMNEKKYGTVRPVSTEVGDMANDIEYKPPKHGGGKSNFYDSSHLKVRGVAGL